MRRRAPFVATVLTVLLAMGVAPAASQDLPEVSPPAIASDNVTLVGQVPDAAAISSAFSSDTPHLYVNTLTGISVYDISNPRLPVLTGTVPMAFFQNENVNLGERDDGTKFVVVGFDAFGVTPTLDPTELGQTNEFAVVDVTDPTDPRVVARQEVQTRTHTVTCVNPECDVLYTSGSTDDSGREAFSIVDLSDHTNPVEVRTHPSSVGQIGHDWNIDPAGVAWHVGWEGTVAYDISDPLHPRVLNATDERALNGGEFNDFIHHNSLRPDADAFRSRPRGQVETGESTQRSAGQLRTGETLLVTEEDYIDTTCENEGSFQTWHVQQLGRSVAGAGGDRIEPGTGTIEPLDEWNSQLLDTGLPSPAGAFCSAHYFTYHQDGFVAIGFYQAGLRILDVRDPTDIKQVGYWFTGAQEAWGGEWVPQRDADGRVTGDVTDLVYVKDPTRGIDILRVELPDTAPQDTEDLFAPIAPEMIVADQRSLALDMKLFGKSVHLGH